LSKDGEDDGLEMRRDTQNDRMGMEMVAALRTESFFDNTHRRILVTGREIPVGIFFGC